MTMGVAMTNEGHAANEARVQKLRRNRLRRIAKRSRLQLRHSDYGYSLVDELKNHVEGRNNMTLDDVERYLARRYPALSA
jgi:hypothetical protein